VPRIVIAAIAGLLAGLAVLWVEDRTRGRRPGLAYEAAAAAAEPAPPRR
jgi:presenilin-like A22 family membrane protease